MARPTTIRREQILDAARELFLDRGFGVSTATIARAAGVSEGSIFKRFATKDELFVASMGTSLPDLGLSDRVGREDIREQLQAVGLELIEFFSQMIPRMMRLWAHSGRSGTTPLEVMQRDEVPRPVRLVGEVAAYLEAEMKLGRLRTVDPKVAARMLVASMHNYIFMKLVAGQAHTPTASVYVRDVVDLLWRGLAPDEVRE